MGRCPGTAVHRSDGHGTDCAARTAAARGGHRGRPDAMGLHVLLRAALRRRRLCAPAGRGLRLPEHDGRLCAHRHGLRALNHFHRRHASLERHRRQQLPHRGQTRVERARRQRGRCGHYQLAGQAIATQPAGDHRGRRAATGHRLQEQGGGRLAQGPRCHPALGPCGQCRLLV